MAFNSIQGHADFDIVSLQGEGTGGTWTLDNIGGVPGGPALGQGGFQQSGGRFTVSGVGDIAPYIATGKTAGDALIGTFVALIVLIVVGTMFITPEHRRRPAPPPRPP